MTDRIEFALLPIEELLEHEEIRPGDADRLRDHILSSGVVEVPLLVARGSLVVLNGHHRLAVLRALGARKIPAYLIDYTDDAVRLERWQAGPPIRKEEVVELARRGGRFPPKTTRHVVSLDLPPHPTPLEALGISVRANSRPGGAASH